MDTSKEKIRHILQFFFDKDENASQAAENVISVYGPDTVTAITRNFGFVDSVLVILMSKMHHALKGQLSKMAIK